jgi:hypothetical protein
MTDGTPLTLRVPKLALGVGSPEAEPAVGVQLLAAMEKTPARDNRQRYLRSFVPQWRTG